MKDYYRVHEVAELLSVSPTTVRRYVREGLLSCDRTPSGQRVFTPEQVSVLLPKNEPKDNKPNAYYLRSSDGDNTKMNNQLTLLSGVFGDPKSDDYIIKDKASGLNDKRAGLKRLIKLSQDGKIGNVYITQDDRLTRFGYSYLEELFTQNNTSIHSLDEDKMVSLQEELLQDFMSLVASFSGKFYRLRGYEQQKQLLNTTLTKINDKQETN